MNSHGRTIWRGIDVTVPGDWEVLQYSRRGEEGNLAWADRHAYRLQMLWREVPGPPDMKRMLSDCRAQLEENGAHSIRDASVSSWQGLADAGVGGSSRLCRYFADTQLLIEVVFLWPKRRKPQIERSVLSSIQVTEPAEGEAQRWLAFGLDAQFPTNLSMTACDVLPANAKWTFSDGERAHQSWHVERLGMLDHWLKEPVPGWLQGKEPLDLVDREASAFSHAEHEISWVQGSVAALRFPKLGKRANRYEAAAWLCPQDGRLYHASRIVPAAAAASLPSLVGHTLRCCKACTSTVPEPQVMEAGRE
jgi:hypothetical protein